MQQRIFDRYVMIDWSAASRPTRGEDSIWRATLDASTGRLDCVNHATRADAERAVTDELAAASGKRVFVGVDFALGYPTGFAERLASEGANWRAVWTAITDEVRDDPTNDNNRFAAASRLNDRAGMSPGPFWGCPSDQVTASVKTTKPATFFGLAEYRLSERRLRSQGTYPHSVWQLFGAGAVGSQSLLGIPMVRRLAEHPALARRVRVWPFDTGCTTDPTLDGRDAIVVGEVWPTIFQPDLARHDVRDAAQVNGVCESLAALDRAGRLGPMFAPSLGADEAKLVEREEGWILGS